MKRREERAQLEAKQKEAKNEEVLVELYQPPQESVVEVSGEGSLEELYNYNEKKEWREMKTEDTTAEVGGQERRVINLKDKKRESLVPAGSKDMHQDLKKQVVDMKQKKWEAAILIQKMYKGYRARWQLKQLK